MDLSNLKVLKNGQNPQAHMQGKANCNLHFAWHVLRLFHTVSPSKSSDTGADNARSEQATPDPLGTKTGLNH